MGLVVLIRIMVRVRIRVRVRVKITAGGGGGGCGLVALIILRNGTELSSHYSTERNGTNTFFAGENITACNSNPMNPTE